jgi:hypothetical protein
MQPKKLDPNRDTTLSSGRRHGCLQGIGAPGHERSLNADVIVVAGTVPSLMGTIFEKSLALQVMIL